MDTLKRKGGELGKFITQNKTLRGKKYIYIKTSGVLNLRNGFGAFHRVITYIWLHAGSWERTRKRKRCSPGDSQEKL